LETFISYAIKTLYVGFVFGILIFFHELGHFFVAKKLKVKVERFSFGFGPVLFKVKRGETEYAISVIPLGGYVKMAGESLNEREGKDYEFYSKSPLKRTAIVAAGPIMSFGLAFLIFYIVIMIGGISAIAPEAKIGGIIEDSPAMMAGLQKGDEIVTINKRRIYDWEHMGRIINSKTGEEIEIMVKRNNEFLLLSLTPQEKILENGQKVGVIGISSEIIIKRNPITAFYESGKMVVRTTYMVIEGLVELIRGKIPAKDALGGPILIARVTARLSEEGFLSVLYFTGFLSVVLGLLNLLPIPILDGGFILFFAIEGIRKKPLSEKTQIIAQNVGLVLLLGVMLYATYNDIIRNYSKIFPETEKIQEQNAEE